MAEAEDVISDLARHATIHAQRLWQRHRHNPDGVAVTQLSDVAPRIELLLDAVFSQHFVLRVAQAPARRSFLRRFFRRHDLPPPRQAVPATNDEAIWLPRTANISDPDAGMAYFRILALRQAMRARRGSATVAAQCKKGLERDLYTILEAYASDMALLRHLPGAGPALQTLASYALQQRPDSTRVPPPYRPMEALLQQMLQRLVQSLDGRSMADGPDAHGLVDAANAADPANPTDPASQRRPASLNIAETSGNTKTLDARPTRDLHALLWQGWQHNQGPDDTLALARQLLEATPALRDAQRDGAEAVVVFDDWTGCYVPPGRTTSADQRDASSDDDAPDRSPRSSRLDRRPTIRKPLEDEDDKEAGIWMIHSGAPTEHVEDPMGMQRPTDRDEDTPVEEFADSVSELAEARLVRTRDPARDVLISDDPPDFQPHDPADPVMPDTTRVHYPEWDYRVQAYREPGTTVHLIPPAVGPLRWVDDTLAQHRGLLWAIRRQFESLRPRRTRQRRQLDGDDLDLDACVEALSDRRAGHSMPQTLYMKDHHAMRDTAVMLLIDISGSTDSWLSAQSRVIDVEREALLLVCTALESVGDPYSVLAFSGEGPHGVTIQSIKSFQERYGMQVAQHIAGLEPDRYTRTGAALRHATAMLMQQPAQHRLLLLLSDGKPNDADEYEGRYGVEDMRQAVNEAVLQGVFPFCLTIDWQAANYLPGVFGAHQYALLPKSEHLPTILLDWLRRLLTS